MNEGHKLEGELIPLLTRQRKKGTVAGQAFDAAKIGAVWEASHRKAFPPREHAQNRPLTLHEMENFLRKSVSELEGWTWKDPIPTLGNSSYVVRTYYQLHQKPIGELEIQELRFLIG
ncbi:hypothetical protein [Hymenobacter arizonensis]|uniref:hypothetical protein n=1 Tax=Hymenobacter arizonensis TaxID=1227077 RepID=UPI000B86E55D|nr:hypothetical protein [Hymenobacter arizonensis]